MKKYFWKTKAGQKIDIDTMSIQHLRNVLKMIVKKREESQIRGDEPESTYSNMKDCYY